MKRTVKILLIVGMAIFVIKYGEIAWRYIDEDYRNKVQVETWKRRILEFQKEQNLKNQLKENIQDTIYQGE